MECIVCPTCGKQLQNKVQLRNHNKVHSNIRFVCDLCSKLFTSKDGAGKHRLLHTGEKPYVCSTCGKAFADASSCKNHEKYQHSQINLDIKCDNCNKTFKREKTLKLHKVIHEQELSSEGTRMKFTNEFKIEALKSITQIGVPETSNKMKIPYTTLRNWMKLCNKSGYNCQYCGKIMSSQQRLKEHETLKHEDKTKVVRQAKFSQSFKDEIAAYATEHSVKEACSKFELADSTVRNILKTLKNPFSCELCNRKCSHKGQLERHMVEVHSKTSNQTHHKQGLAEYIEKENVDLSELTDRYNNRNCISPENLIIVKTEIQKTEDIEEKTQQTDHLMLEETNDSQELKEKILLESKETEGKRWPITEDMQQGKQKINRTKLTHEMMNTQLMIKIMDDFQLTEEIVERTKLTEEERQYTLETEKIETEKHQGEIKVPIDSKVQTEECEETEYLLQIKENQVTKECKESPLNKEIRKETGDNICYEGLESFTEKTSDTSENPHEFENIMDRMKKMNQDEITMFMDFLASSSTQVKGIFIAEKMKVKLYQQNSEDEGQCESVSKSKEIVQEFNKHSYDQDNKIEDNKKDSSDDELAELKEIPSKVQEDQQKVNSQMKMETESNEVKQEMKAEGENEETDSEASSLPANTVNPYKLVPNCRYKNEVDLNEFGIQEDGDVFEISSDFIYNEQLIKSLYGPKYKNKKKVFICSHCNKNYKAPCDIKRHMLKHSDVKEFDCTHCKSAFTQKHNLKRHLLVYHDNNFEGFVCSFCKKKFTQKQSLIEHERTHTGEKPFECKECNERFSYKTTLKAHNETEHEGKPTYKFECTDCNKQFKRSDEFKFHYKSHKEGKPSCEICGASFTWRSGLNKHRQLHAVKSGTATMDFPCEICGKLFFTKGNLSRHIMYHTGQKDYQCSKCGKSYVEKRQLQNHEEIVHEGKKDFQCNECNKYFTRFTTLKAHMLGHTETNVYQCQFCIVKYKQKRNLLKHIEKEHNRV